LCRGSFRLIAAVYWRQQQNQQQKEEGKEKEEDSLQQTKAPSSEKKTILDSNSPLGSDELRFYQRFGIFHKLHHPMPLSYEQYREVMNIDSSNVTSEQLFQAADESFKQSKSCIEKLIHGNSSSFSPFLLSEFHLLAKVAITNSVQIQLMSFQKRNPNSGAGISLNFSVHRSYPVISLDAQ